MKMKTIVAQVYVKKDHKILMVQENKEGIKGKYYIFLRINGKIYKLYKYVIFK